MPFVDAAPFSSPGSFAPFSEPIVIGLPHNESMLQVASEADPPSMPKVPLAMFGAITGHLRKVYDGTLLCARDLHLLNGAFMDGQVFFKDNHEKVSPGT